MICKRNYLIIDKLIKDRGFDYWFPVKDVTEIENTVPQTYPLVLLRSDRYQVYLDLNEKGYGVTSLYHTLIDPLRDNSEYKQTHELEKSCIKNRY